MHYYNCLAVYRLRFDVTYFEMTCKKSSIFLGKSLHKSESGTADGPGRRRQKQKVISYWLLDAGRSETEIPPLGGDTGC